LRTIEESTVLAARSIWVDRRNGVFGDSARSMVTTVREFGAMLLPFTDKERGAAKINAR